MKKNNWKIKDGKVETGLQNYVKSPVLAKLLANRGISTKEDAEIFLNPKTQPLVDPFKFLDMKRAVERIKQAVEKKQKILIWGDFDADGVTSSALLYKVFSKIGANFIYFIPDRKNMGHGLNSAELIKFISKDKVKLVITVDCGISNIKEADLLNSFGVDLIITDHHRAEDDVPNAYAIIDANAPNTIDDNMPLNSIKSLGELAGVGVAYKLYCALKTVYPKLEELNDVLLALVCTGTIADVAPLTNENRTLVSIGLDLINRKVHKGISKLFEMNERNGIITSYDVAFVLTPRINAMGRLSDVKAPFELLAEVNPNNFETIIKTLNNYNKVRQSLCLDTTLEIKDKIRNDKNPVIVEYSPNWHIGIIGIAASNIVEETMKPTFLMTKNEDDDTIRCSIRSPKGYNVYEVLSNLKDNFLGFGGHALAGGFSFDSKTISYDVMKNKIISTFKEMYEGKKAEAYIEVDMELMPGDINEELLNIIKALEPTGEMNPAPLFCIKDVGYLSHRIMGKENNHLKIECLKDNINLHTVWWGHDKFKPSKNFDILFSPKLNIFNGERTIQLEIADIIFEHKDNEIKIFDHRMKTNIIQSVDEYLGRDNVNLDVYIKKAQTLEELKDLQNIKDNQNSENDGIMFFDYPPTFEEFKKIVHNGKYSKFHLMKEIFDDDILNYIRKIMGMTKYAHNQKNGAIDIEKMAEILGVTRDFIQVALEIFEREGAITVKDEHTLKFLKPISDESFKRDTMYEVLSDEFASIVDFKNFINNAPVDKIKEIILQ